MRPWPDQDTDPVGFRTTPQSHVLPAYLEPEPLKILKFTVVPGAKLSESEKDAGGQIASLLCLSVFSSVNGKQYYSLLAPQRLLCLGRVRRYHIHNVGWLFTQQGLHSITEAIFSNSMTLDKELDLSGLRVHSQCWERVS